ncbi:tol-pal system protein YbgF [Ancylobacter sp. MQZ15Z-1]|uniref:Cell division coordinator CpoB n=1 Tax=Ancylobacter mangrovi TaxID=2972472 RepID=A0A9X2PF79_9HYPH|nr:tol-pal system protein YbgF [Ancylobacter mangrovi]MCS0497607.1 tol-pal system protein YbgF [Ancylobacter mangrovi]
MMFRISRFSALLLLAGLTAAVPAAWQGAQAQANNDFFGNLFKPPGQVRQGNNANEGDSPDSLSARMDRLENQMRMMTGQIEQLQYRNQQLENQLRGVQGGAAPAGMPPAAPGAGRGSDAFDPSSQPGAAGAPRPLGTTAPSGPPPGASAGTPPGAPMDLGALSGSVAAAPAPSSESPKDLYDRAYGYMLQQDYSQSGQAFEQFIQLYPNDRAAPDAYYWLGETQFLRKSYKEAAQSFLKVSTDYPNAVKAPDALLRLGQSLAAIGEKDAACATLNAVNNKYPRASTTIKQGVAQEQKRAGC